MANDDFKTCRAPLSFMNTEFRFTADPRAIGTLVFPILSWPEINAFRKPSDRDLPQVDNSFIAFRRSSSPPNYDVYLGMVQLRLSLTKRPLIRHNRQAKDDLLGWCTNVTRSGERHMPSPSLTSWVVKKSSKLGTYCIDTEFSGPLHIDTIISFINQDVLSCANTSKVVKNSSTKGEQFLS